MALLLRCLRDLPILSGDLDLLPPMEGESSWDVLRVSARTQDGGELAGHVKQRDVERVKAEHATPLD